MKVKHHSHDELGWLYHNATRNIEIAKTAQWKILYWALLLDGALIWLFGLLKTSDCTVVIIFNVIAGGVVAVGIYMEMEYQSWMTKQRKLSEELIEKYFCYEFKEVRNTTKSKSGEKFYAFWREPQYLLFFVAAHCIAGGLVLLYFSNLVRVPRYSWLILPAAFGAALIGFALAVFSHADVMWNLKSCRRWIVGVGVLIFFIGACLELFAYLYSSFELFFEDQWPREVNYPFRV